MAPEIIAGGKYKGVEADMFSLGCILFMMCTRIPVTEGTCDPKDKTYKHVAKGRPDLFWEEREKISKRYKRFFMLSSDLKNLIDELICFDPANRLTMA
jgi:serine/threonine protein kinase